MAEIISDPAFVKNAAQLKTGGFFVCVEFVFYTRHKTVCVWKCQHTNTRAYIVVHITCIFNGTPIRAFFSVIFPRHAQWMHTAPIPVDDSQ
jgi:hypothetical protein